jgi:hypothetical protein
MDGRTVGYSFKIKNGVFRTRFVHKSEPGNYVEVATGVAVPKNFEPNDNPPSEAFRKAAQAILKHYFPNPEADPIRADWDKALAHLEQTPDLRQESIRSYRKAVRAVRVILPDIKGPAEITLEKATEFKRLYLGGTFTRAKASDATQYTRSTATCATCLRSLRSLWKKHWRPAGFVRSNPWLEVPYPNAPRGKRVRMPSEQAVTDLLSWLETKHRGWELPILFVQAKLASGCRTMDLCQMKSADLEGLILTFPPEIVKTRTGRVCPLPSPLAARLHAVKGETWLWERSVAEGKKFRPATKTKRQVDYRPATWAWTMSNLFREFNEGREKKDRVRPHDLRARAITLVVAATQSVDATAEALGVDPQTARHYLEASKAFKGSELLTRLGSVLLPPAPVQPPAPE